MKDFSREVHRSQFLPVVVLVLILAALFVRTFDIGRRPFHHDEGVNHFFLEATRDKGYYPYSHENYHGPTHFYAIALSTYLLGEDSEQAMRLPPAIAGVLCLLVVFFFFQQNTFAFLLGGILLSFSPSMVFYSRYSIHEVFFALFSLWFALCVYSWSRTHASHWLYQGAFALALLMLTKETYVITGFCIFWGYLAIRFPRQDFKILYQQSRHVAGALLLLSATTIFVVSGAFQWSGGVREIFLSVPQWIGRNSSDTGHHKEFLYYTKVLWKSEPWLLFLPVVALISSGVLLLRKRSTFSEILSGAEFSLHRFLTVWALVSFFLYSSLKYKMPWLLINITVPAVLALSCWIGTLIKQTLARIVLCAFALVAGIYSTYVYNFQIPYGPDNPFSYVHTSKGMMDLMQDIRSRWKKHPEEKVLIATNQYWPMPYYFRDKKELLAYIRTDSLKENLKKYDVLVMDKTVNFEDPAWEMKYYRLADNQESHTFFRKRND